MIGALVRARRQRTRNWLRYHLDPGTLLRLAAIVALIAAIPGMFRPDPAAWVAAMSRPGFGAAWSRGVLWALPGLVFILVMQARRVRSPGREARMLHVAGAAPGGVARWAVLRQLGRTAPWILGAAIPASMPDGTGFPIFRGLAIAAGLALVSVGTLAVIRPRLDGADEPDRPAVHRASRRLSGGPVRGLIARDVIHLTRRAPGAFVTVAAAAVVEFLVSRSTLAAGNGPMAALIVHLLAATLTVNALLGLFERDAAHPGLLRALPISGRHFWRARVMVAWGLTALPIVPALGWAVVIGATPGDIGWLALLGLVAVPLVVSVLFANVAVALFPRTGITAFFLNIAVALLVVTWFLVPVATFLVAAVVLGLWAQRAPQAFERWEVA